jgi:hypothetical protein
MINRQQVLNKLARQTDGSQTEHVPRTPFGG